ncbi:MAG: hypothetical protein ACFFGZ_09935 [Candidatus Thorarchaeota archaeon]
MGNQPMDKRVYVDAKTHKRLRILTIDRDKGSVGEFVAELLDFWEKHHKED